MVVTLRSLTVGVLGLFSIPGSLSFLSLKSSKTFRGFSTSPPEWGRLGSTMSSTLSDTDVAEMGLTPRLKDIVDGLRALPDDKMRYKQILYLASKGESMPDALKTGPNKVPGCLSTVHVHATLNDEGLVYFQGDSDAQLTKGLVTLLVDGLSGYAPADIQGVSPEFIKFAGLGASLTPG